MKVLEAPAAAIAAEGIEHIFAVMGDANQDIIAELCETHGLKYIRIWWSGRTAPHDASIERSDRHPNYAHAGSQPSGAP